MSLAIPTAEMDRIREHAARDYPHECVGIMLGTQADGRKAVKEVHAITNAQKESPRNRYLTTANDWRMFEKYSEERGMGILGFYHSHPDHPAQPSKYDRDHAWPWLSYLILSVRKGRPEEATSWVLKEDRSAMEEEEVDICQLK